jgi:hypothetical protein
LIHSLITNGRVQLYRGAVVSTRIKFSKLEQSEWIDATDVNVSMVSGSAVKMKTIALIVKQLVANGVAISKPVRLLIVLLCLTALRKSVSVQMQKFGTNIKTNVWM